MTGEPFVLDRVENPHPRMLAEALDLRARWLGYLQAMCAATGKAPDEIEAWMDTHVVPGDRVRPEGA